MRWLFIVLFYPGISFAQSVSPFGSFLSEKKEFTVNGILYKKGDSLNGSRIKSIRKYDSGVYALTTSGDYECLLCSEEDPGFIKFIKDTSIHLWLLDVLPYKSGAVVYSSIIDAPNTSRDELYDRVRMWFAKSVNSKSYIVQKDDKKTGVIVGRRISEVVWPAIMGHSIVVNFYRLYTISVRDNIIKFEITELRVQNSDGDYSIENMGTKMAGKKYIKKLFQNCDAAILNDMIGFESFVKYGQKDSGHW